MSSLTPGVCAIVTGGAGFIGSHLVARLLALGAREVRVIDNCRFGSLSNLPRGDSRLKFFNLDIGHVTPSELSAISAGADYIFHLAAEKHNASIGNPAQMLTSNVHGTYQMLEAAARHKCRKFIFASSLYAYGRITGDPFQESETVCPSTVYGISKFTGEQLVSMYAKRELPAAIVRYMFIYGPRQWSNVGYKSVIVKNFQRMLSGLPPVVYGDGRQILDYLFVSDAVDATIRAAELATPGALFNVGSGTGGNILSLTQLMASIANWSGDITFEAPDCTQGSCRVADISKIRAELGWEPRVSLEGGLRQTFSWIQSRAEHGDCTHAD